MFMTRALKNFIFENFPLEQRLHLLFLVNVKYFNNTNIYIYKSLKKFKTLLY